MLKQLQKHRITSRQCMREGLYSMPIGAGNCKSLCSSVQHTSFRQIFLLNFVENPHTLPMNTSSQIRSANGIKHFWLIASLAYMIACFESKRYNFSEGYHLLSQMIRREQISFVFDYAQNGGDKSALLENIA